MTFPNGDPIRFAGGLNWYAFAGANPVDLLDPYGFSARNRVMGGVQAVGGILEIGVGLTVGATTSWTDLAAGSGSIIINILRIKYSGSGIKEN